MITKDKLITGLNIFASEYLDKIAANNPAVCFMKPLAVRALKNKLRINSNLFDLIAEENGTIDVSSILTEMTEALMKTSQFNINIPIIGDVLIGGGSIEFGIPFLNKSIVFKDTDINYLKELLTKE